MAVQQTSTEARPELGKYREVVVFSGAQPSFVDLSQSHRGDLRKGTKRQDLAIDDPEAGICFRAGYSEAPPGPNSPRHHHNFEQVRFLLSGDHYYGPKKYGKGWLGYFGEGVYYGPQREESDVRLLVVQFPAGSGTPFFSRREIKAAQVRLKENGVISEGGICVWPDGRKQDAGEALWESASGVPIEYPKPRYDSDVWINTDISPWQPSGSDGVAIKRLSYFNERGPAVSLLKLEPGASTPAGKTGSMMLRFVFEGEADYAGQSCPAISGLYYPPAAPYEGVHSRTGATLLEFELQTPGSEMPLPYRV